MPARTGLAATVWSLLHELGVPMRRAGAGSVVEQATKPPTTGAAGDAAEERPAEASEPAPPALDELPPAPTTPVSTEPVAAAPQPPAPAEEQPKAPGRVLRRIQTAALWLRDVGLGATGFVLLVVVATAGFTASFIGLHKFGMAKIHYSDHQAWLVPIAIDGADIGLSVTALRAAMAGRGAFLNRVMIFACTSISSWINYSDVDDWSGRWIAAILPVLAVILLEFLLGEARAAHELRMGHVRPRLSLLRWVFDFPGTWAIFRAYILGIPLPEQMAEAAETVEAEQKTKPRRRRRNGRRKPAAKPATKQAEKPADEDGPGNDETADENQAPIIDTAMVEEFGPKGAHAIALWLDAVNARRPISLRAIDRAIDGNGAAGLAVRKYKQKYGDPTQEVANA